MVGVIEVLIATKIDVLLGVAPKCIRNSTQEDPRSSQFTNRR